MVDLEPDCENCAALCCVALAFDRSEMFAFDKAAGEPCRHLGKGFQCGIHTDLEKQGFKGCVQYSCDGAGQRVVQEVFGGDNWKERRAILQPMLNAFRIMRMVHRDLALLKSAEALPLVSAQRTRLAELQALLTPAESWTESSLKDIESGGVFLEIASFFKSLRKLGERAGREA